METDLNQSNVAINLFRSLNILRFIGKKHAPLGTFWWKENIRVLLLRNFALNVIIANELFECASAFCGLALTWC